MKAQGFLKCKNESIVDANGKNVILKGVNLGGWLMMEGYILHSLNIPEQKFKKDFAKALGKKVLLDFEKNFRDNFITEYDFKIIARAGFNCVRLPFNYRLIEKKPFSYSEDGLFYLDKALRLSKKHGLKLILDLHAAPGSQSTDWHADSLGKAELWSGSKYRERTYALWEFLADRYKDEVAIAGYDLLNEAVVDNNTKLNLFYKDLIRRIRKADKNHILFVEGNNWATDIKCLDQFQDDHIAISIHTYQPWEFTLGFVPQLHYPFKEHMTSCNRPAMDKFLFTYVKEAKRIKKPIFVGEFGVNYREGKYGEDTWLKDTLACFKKYGFHWTYWTFKAIKGSLFPDGVFSFMKNPPWVNRQGPKMGWDTYKNCWPDMKKDMCLSWRTKNFRKNDKVYKILSDASK